MGFLSGLGKILGIGGSLAAAPFTGGSSLAWLPAALGAGGAALGALGQGQAQNRGAQFGGQMDLSSLLLSRELGQAGLQGDADQDFFNQNLMREQEGRASRNDAMRSLMGAGRVLNPGPRPQLSPYSVKPREFSDTERQGAQAMQAEVMSRLQGGNALPQVERRQVNIGMPTVDPRLLQPGAMENISSWLAPILSGLGAFTNQQRQPPLPGMPTPPPVSTGYR